jgi:hypothetical protein
VAGKVLEKLHRQNSATRVLLVAPKTGRPITIGVDGANVERELQTVMRRSLEGGALRSQCRLFRYRSGRIRFGERGSGNLPRLF